MTARDHSQRLLTQSFFPGRDKMRDAGGPVLVRGRGDVDGRHKNGEQSRRRRRRQSREHDVSGRCPTWVGYTHVDAARGAVRATTSSNESRDERRRRHQSPAGASAEEARPQKKVGDDTHPRGVRVAHIYTIITSKTYRYFAISSKITILISFFFL